MNKILEKLTQFGYDFYVLGYNNYPQLLKFDKKGYRNNPSFAGFEESTLNNLEIIANTSYMQGYNDKRDNKKLEPKEVRQNIMEGLKNEFTKGF